MKFDRNAIVFSLLAIIGAIFVLKFTSRITALAPFIALIYATSYIVLLLWIGRSSTTQRYASSPVLFRIISAATLAGALAIVIFWPEASRVGRLPAVIEWIERTMSGRFPWGMGTNSNPSGFPVLFLFTIPFYYIGNVGLMEVAGVLLFIAAITFLSLHSTNRLLPLAGLLLLPTFYYELLVRSELLFNMMVVIMLLIGAEQYLYPKRFNGAFFLLAILFGLCLSTRLVVGAIYAVYFAYKFRENILSGLLFAMVVLLTFVATLMPFIVWDAKTFFEHGPFSVQMVYLPSALAVLFALGGIVAGWRARSFRDLLFATGVLLFCIVATALTIAFFNDGVTAVLIGDRFNISYFIFSAPFLLLSLMPERKPLGSEAHVHEV